MVDGFFKKVQDAVLGSNDDQDATNYDDREVRPASEDPFGDPADSGEYGDVRPASEDPFGDPADSGEYGQFGDVRSASEDPYGDPADEEYA
ncbi:translation initiation factor [Coleofasciculus sp. H7-2]|uniref:translation initiation factor n=1 Tax=Coleofasciculus sp. H7-2 TaxID=3351545 RepID=UPI0036717343